MCGIHTGQILFTCVFVFCGTVLTWHSVSATPSAVRPLSKGFLMSSLALSVPLSVEGGVPIFPLAHQRTPVSAKHPY